MKMKMKMGVTEYSAHGGNVCPFCESENHIHTFDIEQDDDIIYRDCECWNCGNGWVEYFTITDLEPWS